MPVREPLAAPSGLLAFLRRRRRVRVAGYTWRLPPGGDKGLAERLRRRWRRELLEAILPKEEGKEFGHVIDAGAGWGESMIDLAHTARRTRYVGFEPDARRAEYANELAWANGFQLRVTPAALTAQATVLRLPGGESRPRLAAGLPFDALRHEVAPGPIRLVNINAGGAELGVLQGMRATLSSDRPLLLADVRFAGAGGPDEERRRKEGMQEILAELCYVIMQLVITVQWDFVGGARMREFPLAAGTAAGGNQCQYLMAPKEEMTRLGRVLF